MSFLFFFCCKISFLFVSLIFKFSIYKVCRKYYDILFRTKFLSCTRWWRFHQILIGIFFFSQNLFPICIWDFWIWCVQIFEQKWRNFISDKILDLAFLSQIKPSYIFFRKISLLFLYLASKYSLKMFSRQNRGYFNSGKILVPIRPTHFCPKFKRVFFLENIFPICIPDI